MLQQLALQLDQDLIHGEILRDRPNYFRGHLEFFRGHLQQLQGKELWCLQRTQLKAERVFFRCS
jgi:hypothetical protein